MRTNEKDMGVLVGRGRWGYELSSSSAASDVYKGQVWQSRWLSHLSGAISMVHEKPGDYLHQSCSCTHNRIRSPR